MRTNSEGTTGPVGPDTIGIRFELSNAACEYIGSDLEEDKGALAPRSRELLARGTFTAWQQRLGNRPAKVRSSGVR